MSVTDRTGPAAIALDDLLTDPAKLELLRDLRERYAAATPVSQLDQDAAAYRDASAFLRLEAQQLNGGQLGLIDHAKVPDWIRLGLLHATLDWIMGRSTTCMCSPSYRSPQPVFATAWKPGVVTCARCVHITALRPGSAADRRCDCCGRVVAGLEHGDGIHPGRVQLGPLIYAYGACRGCRPTPNTEET